VNPPDLKYTKDHEWVRLEDGGIVVVGITEHAQDSLGDVVLVDAPDDDSEVAQFGRFGEIESVKAVSELFSPLTGRVVESNPLLADQPELVNQDPYGRGWIIRLEASNLSELENLLSAAEYDALVAELGGH
jgi:glycine cleavage system H protein